MTQPGRWRRNGAGRGKPAQDGPNARARLRAADSREKWGYAVWLFIGLIFGIPESWAGIATPPWPALSDTVGHLEKLWSPVAVIVVVLIVFVAYSAVRYPVTRTGEFEVRPGGPRRARTGTGRLTKPGGVALVPTFVYLPLALGVIAAGSVIAAVTSSDMFVLGYVIYGLFAIFLVLIPSAMAYWFARDVPFPTLARTVANLERRWPPVAMVILAGLVVLMFHLVFFPWPG
jgi:hypothetical protein